MYKSMEWLDEAKLRLSGLLYIKSKFKMWTDSIVLVYIPTGWYIYSIDLQICEWNVFPLQPQDDS